MSFNKPNFNLLFSALFIVSLFIASCTKAGADKNNKAPQPSETSAHSVKNDTTKLIDAPNFTLKKMDGKSFTLSNHKGQVVVLNVWATWCPPCRKEIPSFIKLQKELRNKGVLFCGRFFGQKRLESRSTIC